MDGWSAISACEIGTQGNKNDSQTKPTISHSAEWKRSTENTPVYAVVSAITGVEGSDLVELRPIYEAIDPEALHDLLVTVRTCY